MQKIIRYLTSACLFFAGYVSTGVVYADASSMQALADDAVGKARECSQASAMNRKTGQYNNTLVDECSLACSRAYQGLSGSNRKPPSQEQQLAQMERCKRAYNNYKSPETASVEDEITMPTTVEEMATRMSAMKREGRTKNDPCVDGVKGIRHRQLGLEQAKLFWNRCVQRYKMDMKMRRATGG
ncbi:hypothetical protein DFR30_0932 [Thiogranum longum]|uniref:PsiF repeat-containing protein n=1 Tax=Thiogranum longum TaxID=1537524 RepID=A0A4R1HAS3_9GAMM|nr:hypothetical protein [Thiogranum longum]TCK17691.1 hypothetical protein DFR30_0932 [Thiogranum longum]